MKIAGVRTSEGMAWAGVGEHDVSLLDEVTVQVEDGERQGTVVITPDQMVNLPEPNGEIVAVCPRVRPDSICDDLPGSHMPPLGSRIEIDGADGTVVAVDARNGLITISSGGIERTIPVSNFGPGSVV